MAPDYFSGLFVRLCFAGPLLYVGLQLACDPEGFVTASRNLAMVLQELNQSLRGRDSRNWIRSVEPGRPPARTRSGVRIAGIVISLCALLPFALVN